MTHPYLVSKQLDLIAPLRIEGKKLIVPAFENGIEVAAQEIWQTKIWLHGSPTFEKRNRTGSKFGNGYCSFTAKDMEHCMPAQYCWIVVEGIATGLAIREIFAKLPVRIAVVFGLERIATVVKALLNEYPQCVVQVAGDRGSKSEQRLFEIYRKHGVGFALPPVPAHAQLDNYDWWDAWDHTLKLHANTVSKEVLYAQLRQAYVDDLKRNEDLAREYYRSLPDTADGPPPIVSYAKAVEEFLALEQISGYEHRHYTNDPLQQTSQIILHKGCFIFALNELRYVDIKGEGRLARAWKDFFILKFGESYLNAHVEMAKIDLSEIELYVTDDMASVLADVQNPIISAGAGSGKTVTMLKNVFAPLVRARMAGDLNAPLPILFLPGKVLIRAVLLMILKHCPDTYEAVQRLTREDAIGQTTQEKIDYLLSCPGIVTHYHYLMPKGLSDRGFPLARAIFQANSKGGCTTVHFGDEIHELISRAKVVLGLDSRFITQIGDDLEEENGYFTSACKAHRRPKSAEADYPCVNCSLEKSALWRRSEGGLAGIITHTNRPPNQRNEAFGKLPELDYQEGDVIEIARIKIVKPEKMAYVNQNDIVKVTTPLPVGPFSLAAALTQSTSIIDNPINPDIEYLAYLCRLHDMQVHQIFPLCRRKNDDNSCTETRILPNQLIDPDFEPDGTMSFANYACEARVLKAIDPYPLMIFGLAARRIYMSATISDTDLHYLHRYDPQTEYFQIQSTQPKLKRLYLLRYPKTLDLANEAQLTALTAQIKAFGGDYLLGLARKTQVEHLSAIEALIDTRIYINEIGRIDWAVDDAPVCHLSYMHHGMFTGTNQPKRRLIILDANCHEPLSTFFLPYANTAWTVGSGAKVEQAVKGAIADNQDALCLQAANRNARWVTKEDSPEIDYAADNGGYRMVVIQSYPTDITGRPVELSDAFRRSIEDRYEEIVYLDIPAATNAKQIIYERFKAFFTDCTNVPIIESKEQAKLRKAEDRVAKKMERYVSKAKKMKGEGKNKEFIYRSLNLHRLNWSANELENFWKDVQM